MHLLRAAFSLSLVTTCAFADHAGGGGRVIADTDIPEALLCTPLHLFLQKNGGKVPATNANFRKLIEFVEKN